MILTFILEERPATKAKNNVHLSSFSFQTGFELSFVPVKIEGEEPVLFMCDTGGRETVVQNRIADKLKWPILEKVRISGTGGGRIATPPNLAE